MGRDVAASVGRAVTNVDKTTEPVDKLVNNTIDNIKNPFLMRRKKKFY
jgi:hypothetical protein